MRFFVLGSCLCLLLSSVVGLASTTDQVEVSRKSLGKIIVELEESGGTCCGLTEQVASAIAEGSPGQAITIERRLLEYVLQVGSARGSRKLIGLSYRNGAIDLDAAAYDAIRYAQVDSLKLIAKLAATTSDRSFTTSDYEDWLTTAYKVYKKDINDRPDRKETLVWIRLFRDGKVDPSKLD